MSKFLVSRFGRSHPVYCLVRTNRASFHANVKVKECNGHSIKLGAYVNETSDRAATGKGLFELVEFIRLRKTPEELPPLSLLQSVYSELYAIGDWVTGLKILKKFQRIKAFRSSVLAQEITSLVFSTFLRGSYTLEELQKTSSNLCSEGKNGLNQDTLSLFLRAMILCSSDFGGDILPNIMFENIDALEWRNPLILYYGVGGELREAQRVFMMSFPYLNKDDFAFESTVIQEVLAQNGKISQGLFESIICMTIAVIGPRSANLCSYLPTTAGEVQENLKEIKKLFSLAFEVAQRISDLNQGGFELFADFPLASTLEIFRKASLCVFRCVLYTEGLEGVEKFKNTILSKLEYLPQDRITCDLRRCIHIAYVFCIKDILSSSYTKKTPVELLNAKNQVNQSISFILSVYGPPQAGLNLHRDFRKFIVQNYSKGKRGPVCEFEPYHEIFINAMQERHNNQTLNIDKTLFPSVVVDLLVHSCKDIVEFYFAEQYLQLFVRGTNVFPDSYFKALLDASRFYGIKGESFTKVIDFVRMCLFRACISGVKQDRVIITSLIRSIERPKNVDRNMYKPQVVGNLIQITSHIFEALMYRLCLTVDEELLTMILISYISNDFYEEFYKVYTTFRLQADVRPSIDFFVKWANACKDSYAGCIYFAKELRFYFDRQLKELELEWTTELVNAVAECCLASGDIMSTVAFARTHKDMISKSTVKKIIQELETQGSLCHNDIKLLQSWKLSRA